MQAAHCKAKQSDSNGDACYSAYPNVAGLAKPPPLSDVNFHTKQHYGMDWIHTNIAFSAVPRSNNETVFSPIPFRDPMMPHRAKRMFDIWEIVRKSTAGIWTGLRRTSANIISPSSHPKLLTIQSRTMHLRLTEMDEMLKETIATEKIARLWSLRGSMFRWIKPGSQVVIFDLIRLSAHAFEREGPSFQLLHIPETVKTPISTVIEYQWTV